MTLIPDMPGMSYLIGAVDCHVHACPHLGARSLTVFEAVRQASAAGMRGIGLMDVFSNSAGYAALVSSELRSLGVEVFGGLIMQPCAGGVAVEPVKVALGYGYGPGTGARFISSPTNHTRHVASQEGRDAAYLETTFSVPPGGEVPDTVKEIMDLVAVADVVFDCGDVSGPEALVLSREAARRGLKRVRTHGSRYRAEHVEAIAATGAFVEFSFFFLTHAVTVALTHVGPDRRRVSGGVANIQEMALLIRAATPACSILSSDCGVSLLPPPVEGLREFMLLLESEGFNEAELRLMNATNPSSLFGIGRIG